MRSNTMSMRAKIRAELDEAIKLHREAEVAVETMGFDCPEDEQGDNEREFKRLYLAAEEAESNVWILRAKLQKVINKEVSND